MDRGRGRGRRRKESEGFRAASRRSISPSAGRYLFTPALAATPQGARTLPRPNASSIGGRWSVRPGAGLVPVAAAQESSGGGPLRAEAPLPPAPLPSPAPHSPPSLHAFPQRWAESRAGPPTSSRPPSPPRGAPPHAERPGARASADRGQARRCEPRLRRAPQRAPAGGAPAGPPPTPSGAPRSFLARPRAPASEC